MKNRRPVGNGILVAFSLAAFGAAMAVSAADKVTICHKDRNTITVAEAALDAHLAHGDSLDACPPPPEPEEGEEVVEQPTQDVGLNVGVSVVVVVPVEGVEVEPAPACVVPPESETDIVLEDGSTFRVSLLSRQDNEWTYQVEGLEGKDLSHWSLGIEACLDHIETADDGAQYGVDGSTGFNGVKWDSEGGVFSFTLDGDYPDIMVEAMAKAGNDSATGSIIGPDCTVEPIEDDGEAAEPEAEEVTAETDEPETEAPSEEDMLTESEAVVTLEDGSSYYIALVAQAGATWTYQVERDEGKDLSHWSLGIESCLGHIESADDGAEIGTDGSTGFIGVKWDSEGGEFSVTLDGDYPATELEVIAKAGNDFGVAQIIGPDCTAEPLEDDLAGVEDDLEGVDDDLEGDEVGNDDGAGDSEDEGEGEIGDGLPMCDDPNALAAVPAEQVLLLERLQSEWDAFLELDVQAQLEWLIEMGYTRPFLYQDLLYVPEMQIPRVELVFGGLTYRLSYSALIQRVETEEGVTYVVVASQTIDMVVTDYNPDGTYSLDEMTLLLPVVDSMSADGEAISSFSLDLTVVSLDPVIFMATDSSLMITDDALLELLEKIAAEKAEQAEGDSEEAEGGDDEEGDEEEDQQADDELS